MNGREAFSEELLSAYLDGEVTVRERQLVEKMLEQSPELLRKYTALCALNEQLRTLDRYQLSDPTTNSILNAIAGTPLPAAETPSPEGLPEELLSAYIDGELDDFERDRVERHLEHDEKQRHLVAELRQLHEDVASLPAYHLDQGFASRVVQQIEALPPSAPMEVVGPADLVALAPKGSERQSSMAPWRGVIWTVATIAVALLLMVFLSRNGDQQGSQVAQPDPGLPGPTQPGSPDVKQPRGSGDQIGTGPMVAQTQEPSQIDVTPQRPVPSPLTFVSSLRRKKLVLVYEIAVTEEGAENAAFSNLLRRHRIGFNETSPVTREEQDDLLQHRFLENVQVADQRRDEMDRVDLYLVTTTALTADGLYADLMSKPVGVGGFALNLTSRDARDRVLNRLCDSSGVEDNVGEAVQLLANFGILSSTARNVGAFGAIRWVDPSLYEVPSNPKPRRDPMPDEAQQAGPEVANAQQVAAPPRDFPCELLFVVRHWGVRPPPPSASRQGG